MALNDMQFTNTVGSVTLGRIMCSFSHNYVWDGGGPAKAVVTVTVSGVLKTTESNLEAMASRDGDSGVLELPNKTYPDMRLTSVSHESGTWAQWGRVSLSFTDENAGEHLERYSIDWYEYTLYNPRIQITPSTIKRSEKSIHGTDGWQRQQLGHKMFTVSLSGTLQAPAGELPAGLIESMEKSYDGPTPYPSGYPLVFDLVDAVPQASGHLGITNLIVTNGNVAWNFEKEYADVTIEMIAPPQEIE